jgi:hypothetical protein
MNMGEIRSSRANENRHRTKNVPTFSSVKKRKAEQLRIGFKPKKK